MDNLKSILFVLPSNAVGGAESKFFSIIKGLSGVHSILLTHSPVVEYFTAAGIRTYAFEKHGCYESMPVTFTKTLRYAKAITEIFRNEKPDCIAGIMHTGSFYVSVARDIFRLKIPVIATIEGNITAYFTREERTPTLIEKSLLWYLLRRPDRIAVPSEGVKNDLAKNFNMPEKKITVIYNGIDSDKVRKMAEELPDDADTYNGKTIITACRLNAQKDFNTLLTAFREVKEKIESRLIIVGGGELKDEIVNNAAKLGIGDDVIITGFQKNPFRFIKSADVFVLSSFFEGFGNVIVEAMALGVPVVATDCPSGPGEIIQHGVNGFLVPVKDHNKMADAIMSILTDKKTRDELAVNGIQRAEFFNAKTMLKEFEMLIRKVCSSNGKCNYDSFSLDGRGSGRG